MNKLYFRLAKVNIKNNTSLYLPYILSGIFSIAMFYVMKFLCTNEGLNNMPGADSLKMIMAFGVAIILIFTYIFLFYTNSFIIKRRKKEIGVYNILGMEKRHIAKVLGIETVMVAVIAIGGGLAVGILFSKLMLMLLYKLLGFSETIVFQVEGSSIFYTVTAFAVLYFLLLLYNLMQIKLAKPVELLRGGNVGEKEPKTKLVMAILGAICLGIGYFISITTKDPLSAIPLFFVAVLLVIVGTYFLFIAGSVAILKALRKNKNFYYKRKNFTAISGMLYRMKQNAAGLASICILSTMVLVMVSTTVCMFVGIDDELKTRWPYDLSIYTSYESIEEVPSDLNDRITDAIRQEGRTIGKVDISKYFEIMATPEDNKFVGTTSRSYNGSMAMLYIFTRDNFIQYDTQFTEENVPQVGKGEVVIYSPQEFKYDEITVFDQTYSVASFNHYDADKDAYMSSMLDGSYYVIVDSAETEKLLFNEQKEQYPDDKMKIGYSCDYSANIDGTKQEKIDCSSAIKSKVIDSGDYNFQSVNVECRDAERDGFYAVYGGFFFLGIFLGIMFLMVTVMIIFYKQISEGYDDKNRYEIMEKVGMSNQEVKESIHSQILFVFFLPIGMAVIHVMAAFPMIKQLLAIFNLTNISLFVICLLITILIFLVIYLIIFLITSKAYYKIVGNQVR